MPISIREKILTAFNEQLADPSRVRDIRGLGLMLGIELTIPTANLVEQGLERDILINVTVDGTIRLLPPLIMTDNQATELGYTVAQVVNNAKGSSL